MHMYGKLCALFLLLAWCSSFALSQRPVLNIQVCSDFEEYTYSYACQPTCAERTCTITSESAKRETCTCKLGYIRQYTKGPCIRTSRCPL
uniref:TIL domain-containing protein n=1 Tax=Anopheles epiroticus TaxID=199890 RepID=A0A182P3S8_9DIPT